MRRFRRLRRLSAFALLALAALTPAPDSSAQTAAAATIRATAGGKQWMIDAGEFTYAVGINDQGMPQTLYWGPKLPATQTLAPARMSPERASFDAPIMTTMLEYPAFGAGLFTEPALKADSANGDRTLVLQFRSARTNGGRLELVLADKVQPLRVHLFYQPYGEGILARWATIENVGRQPFTLEQAASATWNLPPARDYTLSWLTGAWAAEWQMHTAALAPGAQVLESRRGSTGHQANPWFAVGKGGQTTETAGPVWFGELGWSGSWRMSVERTALDLVRITAGYNPFDFAWRLEPGTTLETPRFYAGYTAHGQGEASRILHRFQRAEILPDGPNPKPRPVIYNSWEATGFNVDERGQMALADRAAQLGVERFVMDDGWFGERVNGHAGLGDWTVNPQKFPRGLKPLIDHVHGLGMDFGLWVEPEMVNPDSDLYRRHPDWVLNFPGRQRTEARNQLVLNLARPEVRQYVLGFLEKLLDGNDIAFLKWDYNRNWSEPGWPEAGDLVAGEEVYVRYIQNLYSILAELRRRHPKLEIESCSGGGGRVDDGILRYTDEVWPSDNTDALDRLNIQDGFTHAYAPQTMAAWVTDVPNYLDGRVIPLQFRFLVAMQGALGIGSNLSRMSADDLALAARLTAFYKQVRTTVQHGELYRLLPPGGEQAAAVEYVGADGKRALLLAYLHAQRYGFAQPAIHLEGLAPEAMYRIRALDAGKYEGPAEASGALLMGGGVNLKLAGDYDATALVLEREQ